MPKERQPSHKLVSCGVAFSMQQFPNPSRSNIKQETNASHEVFSLRDQPADKIPSLDRIADSLGRERVNISEPVGKSQRTTKPRASSTAVGIAQANT